MSLPVYENQAYYIFNYWNDCTDPSPTSNGYILPASGSNGTAWYMAVSSLGPYGLLTTSNKDEASPFYYDMAVNAWYTETSNGPQYIGFQNLTGSFAPFTCTGATGFSGSTWSASQAPALVSSDSPNLLVAQTVQQGSPTPIDNVPSNSFCFKAWTGAYYSFRGACCPTNPALNGMPPLNWYNFPQIQSGQPLSTLMYYAPYGSSGSSGSSSSKSSSTLIIILVVLALLAVGGVILWFLMRKK